MSNRDTIFEGRDDDGGAPSNPASRPSGGKFSSLLAYLDEASASHNFCQEVVVSHHADGDSSPSSSLPCSVTSSSGHLAGRQLVAQQASGKRVALGKNLVIDSRREGPQSRDGARVPWDSSIKSKHASARRLTAEGARREDAMDPRSRVAMPGGKKGSAAKELSCASIANRPSMRSIPHYAACKEGIVGGNDLIHEHDKLRLCSGKRVDSQMCSSNYRTAECPEADETVKYNGNGSGRSQRWVWDEWDLNNDDSWGDDNNNSSRRTTVDDLEMIASSGGASLSKPIKTQEHSDKPGCQNAGKAHVVPDCRLSCGNDSDVISSRQAFEDVQASARTMREELRERRSEVGF